MKAAVVAAGAVCTAAAVVAYARWRRQQQQHSRRVLVVGSINVDLYQRTVAGAVRFVGESVRCPGSDHALPPCPITHARARLAHDSLALLSLADARRPAQSLCPLPAAQVDLLPLFRAP